MNIQVRESSLAFAERVHARIPEFDPGYLSQFYARCEDQADGVILVAFSGEHPVGYALSYGNGEVLYVWMVAVAPEARRQGVLASLMATTEAWAQERGYQALTLKTRNDRREMLAFLVRDGWDFVSVEEVGRVSDWRIHLRKTLAA